MQPRLKDIAEACRLSVSTVSHILNQREGIVIAEATRNRVLEAARRLHYRPNRIARGTGAR